MTNETIYVVNMLMPSGGILFHIWPLFYTHEQEAAEHFLKAHIESERVDLEGGIFYRIQQAPMNKYLLYSSASPMTNHAPNGEQLASSPLDAYDVDHHRVQFTHQGKVYEYNHEQYEWVEVALKPESEQSA